MQHLMKLTWVALMMSWVTPSFAETPVKESSTELESAEAETTLTEKQLAEQWAYDFMVAKVPPGTKIYYPEGEETPEETIARYRSIATDVIEVSFNPEIQVPFTGPSARTRTAALILGVMFHESSFTKHVDYGLGKYARGDEGRSWCMMQLNIGSGRTLVWNTKHDRPKAWGDDPADLFEGYTGEEVVKDRKKCIQEGLKVLRLSIRGCRSNALLEKLASYTSGDCNKGLEKSRTRMGTAIRYFEQTREQRKKFSEEGVQVAVVAALEKQEVLRLAEERRKQKQREKQDAGKVAVKEQAVDES